MTEEHWVCERSIGPHGFQFEAVCTDCSMQDMIEAHGCIYRLEVDKFADGKVSLRLIPDNGMIDVNATPCCSVEPPAKLIE